MVCIVIGVILFIFVLVGYLRGMFRVLISAASLIASIIIAVYAAPHLSAWIQENTQADEKIAAYISEQMSFSGKKEETSKGVQVEEINSLGISEQMKGIILNNNNSDMYKVLGVTGVYDYISKSIAVMFINVMVFVLLAGFCRVFFFILKHKAGNLTEFPVVKWMDRTAGALLGAAKGVLLVWIFFLILSVTGTYEWSRECTKQVRENAAVNYLYENNLLTDLVVDVTKVMFP